MNIREGVRTSRRHQVRLSAPLDAELSGFAASHGLGLSPAIRFLLGRGLQLETGSTAALQDSAATLAALVAAEQAVLMVASILPEGGRRMGEARSQAAGAAQQRLAEIGDQIAEEPRL